MLCVQRNQRRFFEPAVGIRILRNLKALLAVKFEVQILVCSVEGPKELDPTHRDFKALVHN